MSSEPIRFTDGAGYDRFMGVWSRLAGQEFLDWIGPSQGQCWLDVGCGNGAFTQLIAERGLRERRRHGPARAKRAPRDDR